MNETITITLEEYRNLIAKAERIETIGRMFARTYVSTDDIRAVLDIETPTSEES